ncbi:MAG: CapA family protein [Gemmatimonadales bacterium]|jgi:poly-gamma-glutamate synthesis protein (capsule biosynthesis protein)
MSANRGFRTLVSLAVVLLGLANTAQAQRSDDLPGPQSTWSLAAAGDAIITRRISPFDHPGDPGFHRLAYLVRAADAAFVNLELSLFRLDSFEAWPEAENGGNWELAPPEVAYDLKEMGFDLYNRANNHTTDLGVEGMRLTNQLLDSLGLIHSGSGMNLGWASRPGYLDTPKGRIALIGFATTFTPMSRASDPRGPYMGRPGLNPLRVRRTYEADSTTFEHLSTVAANLGGRVPEEPDEPIRLFGVRVHRGEVNRVVTELNSYDEERILGEIRNASRLADFVVVNSHSHDRGAERTQPPEWLREFAKRCLDAGAATYIIHGPHILRGIEIHDGKPIFYSLGNFIFQNETIDPMPQDNYENYDLDEAALAADLYDRRFRVNEEGEPTTGFPSSPVWYESVLAVPTFQGSRLVDLKLYPIDLAQTAPRSQRGTPRLADEGTGRKIIEHLGAMSAEFGTTIEYKNGIGVWRPVEPVTSPVR